MKNPTELRPRVALLPVLIAAVLSQPLYAQDATPEPAPEDEDTTELSGVALCRLTRMPPAAACPSR